MSLNQYGLSRRIPDNTAREVRKRCRFGCILCGELIVEYHHFDPEFAEAKYHDSNGITLFCPSCHTRVHNGYLSPHEIRKLEKKRPRPIQTTLLNQRIKQIRFGSIEQPAGPMIIERKGPDEPDKILFGLMPLGSFQASTGALISGNPSNKTGLWLISHGIEIIENSIMLGDDLQDAKVTKSSLNVVSNSGSTILMLKLQENEIIVDQIKITNGENQFSMNQKNWTVRTRGLSFSCPTTIHPITIGAPQPKNSRIEIVLENTTNSILLQCRDLSSGRVLDGINYSRRRPIHQEMNAVSNVDKSRPLQERFPEFFSMDWYLLKGPEFNFGYLICNDKKKISVSSTDNDPEMYVQICNLMVEAGCHVEMSSEIPQSD